MKGGALVIAEESGTARPLVRPCSAGLDSSRLSLSRAIFRDGLLPLNCPPRLGHKALYLVTNPWSTLSAPGSFVVPASEGGRYTAPQTRLVGAECELPQRGRTGGLCVYDAEHLGLKRTRVTMRSVAAAMTAPRSDVKPLLTGTYTQLYVRTARHAPP